MRSVNDFDGKKNICGRKVREARNKRGLTQDDFAARLQVEGVNIGRDSVSRLEKGTRFVADYELKILAKVLEVELDWLLSDD